MKSNSPKLFTLLSLFLIASLGLKSQDLVQNDNDDISDSTKYEPPKNSVKGRIIYAPLDGYKVVACGIGFERFIDQSKSVQLLYNFFFFDGIEEHEEKLSKHALTLSYRKYFGKNSTQNINKSFFVDLHVELSLTKINYSPTYEPTPNDITYSIEVREITSIAPGILFGKNFQIAKNWYLESFLGLKLNNEYEELLLRNNNDLSDELTTTTAPENRLGYRLGFNVGYRF